MGTIFSGVGLASGLDIQSIVDKLIAIDSRPRDLLKSRITRLDAQKTAYLDLSARISALLTRVSVLSSRSSFLSTSAISSQPEALSVTTGENAPTGTFRFRVLGLAATQQVVSRGFTSATAPLTPGALTIESARARVDQRTKLDELNGYAGVQRGNFRIVDATGAERTISLSDAVTLQDVADRINAAGTNVRAAIRGDRLSLTETTGGRIEVREVDDGRVASDLGFPTGNMVGSAGSLEGRDLMRLSAATPLASLNDGNGVSVSRAGGDFTINGVTVDLDNLVRTGTRLERLNHGNGVTLGRIRITTVNADGDEVPTEVDLANARTLGDVKSAIETAVPGLTVSTTGSRLNVGYAAAGDKRLKIEDLSGSSARDLGITGDSASGRISGRDILFNDTVGDLLAAINFAEGNDAAFSARLDGTRLVIESQAGVTLAASPESSILEDLGLEGSQGGTAVVGRRILSGVDTVLMRSLNGGRGVKAAGVLLTAGTVSARADLSGAETLAEAMQRIRDAAAAAGIPVDMGYDSTGLRLTMTSRDGVTPVNLEDDGGDFAQISGLTGSAISVRGQNLQRQYVSEATALAALNAGRGVTLGKFKITNSQGVSATIDLTGTSVKNIRDVMAAINGSSTLNVRARLNDTGDGILLEDQAGGNLTMKVVEEGSTTARDLNLLGDAVAGRIDGSYEQRIEVTAGMTLQELVTRVNSRSGGLASASILNDGTPVAPFRLQLTSRTSGTSGEMVIDARDLGLDFSTLTRAQDARVALGDSSIGGIIVTSSSNTLRDIVPGMTLNLLSSTDDPVDVTINRDLSNVRGALDGLVQGFNQALDRIKELTKYDAESNEAGILLGDNTTQTVEARLLRAATGALAEAAGNLRRLSDLGVKMTGGRLAFDQARFDAAYAADPEAVVQFFSNAQNGLGQSLKKQLEAITTSEGLIGRRSDMLDGQKDSLNDRIERMDELLGRKRERLMRQYQAMEQALSSLQSQQSALGQISYVGSPPG